MGKRVAIHRQQSIVVLRHHKTVRVHAERADTIIKTAAVIYQFGFIADIRDRFMNLRRRFHAHPDIYRIVGHTQPQFFYLFHKPFRAIPSWSG